MFSLRCHLPGVAEESTTVSSHCMRHSKRWAVNWYCPNNKILYHEAMDMNLSNLPEKWDVCHIIAHKVKYIL